MKDCLSSDNLDAIVIEFKVFNSRRDNSLEDTLQAALLQIEEKKYAQVLVAKGISEERIRKYGFVFEGEGSGDRKLIILVKETDIIIKKLCQTS